LGEGRLDKLATWALAGFATVIAELALAEPGRPVSWSLAVAALHCVVAAGLQAGIDRLARSRDPRPGVAEIAIVALFLLPFVAEAARLVGSGRSRTLELALLAALRNLGLGLAALSSRSAFGRLSAVVSLFLVLTAASVAEEGATVLVALGGYAVAGGLWLSTVYWRRPRTFAAARRPRRFPVAALALAALVVAAVASVAAIGPARAAMALASLVPSSGGTLWDDPDARGGVGDGENEVDGSERPESIGFTESETYLDSDRPSLYDAFNDTYGEPLKPRRQERMIALANPNVVEPKARAAENLRAGRRFSAVRRPPDRGSRRPGDRGAKALVYVKGPTPLHLGLAAYDRFDGRDWHEEPRCERDLPLEREADGGPWLRVALPPQAFLVGATRHQVKVGTLDSGPLPAPSHVARFRVGQVDCADFFEWAQEGIVRMAGRTVPSGTIVETESRTPDPRRLRAITFPGEAQGAGRHLGSADDDRVDPAAVALARSWADGAPRGWPQVEALVDGLRGHAVHDRGASAPPECDDVVADFLLRSRRGPDYLFATSAAVLLRSLGYPSRLVSGLYADPARYDPRTRHTPVKADDVHVWTEVRLPNGAWVAVEPTPGYRLRGPDRPWYEVILAASLEAAGWAWAHRVILTMLVGAVVVLLWRRREVADGIATLAWNLGARLDPHRSAVRALRLVDRRSGWAGRGRPAGQTPRRWYGPLVRLADGPGADLDRLLRLAEWGLYAPRGTAPPLSPSADHDVVCKRAMRRWTLRRFRDLSRELRTENEAST
jgi:transglutaminase-like putative cysteine protease